MPNPIRVMIVDDHAVVRSGLSTFLLTCDDMELVGEAAGGEEALRLCERARPDVVLMDLVMPGMDGATATRLIRQRCPDIQVVVLTSFKEQDLVQGALQAGAIGYLLKDVSAEELANAITEDTERPPHEKLSDREYQTLVMIASGKTLTQIAEELKLSVKTVSVYRARLLEKMKLKNNAELTHYGLKHGLVE